MRSIENKIPQSLQKIFVFTAFLLCFGCVQFEVVPIEQIEGGGAMPAESSGGAVDEGGNAAQEFCQENGGTIANREDSTGGYVACALADGSECEIWALYDGDCGDLVESSSEDENYSADGFEVDMGEEEHSDEADHSDDMMETTAGSEDWDIIQDMFYAGEVVGVSVESDNSLTITLIDESVVHATPPDEYSLDDVLDVCGATCDSIFIAE